MKKQESHSIFCCFCYDNRPRRTNRDTHSYKSNNKFRHDHKEYKIDTNSNISCDKKSINSLLVSKHNNNTINHPNNNGSITKNKDNPNYSSIEKNKMNDKKSNATCSTVNYNIKQLLDKNKPEKQELNASLKKRNKTVLVQQYNYYTIDNKMKNNNNYITNIINNNINTNTNDKYENIEHFLNKNEKNSRNSKLTNNSMQINESINNDMNEIMNNSKRIKGFSAKSYAKSQKVFEFEDQISNYQIEKTNKSNLNKSITKIIDKSNYKSPKREEIKNNNNINESKNIVNILDDNINNTKNECHNMNDKNSDISKNLNKNIDSIKDNKNDCSNNNSDAILSPKNTKIPINKINNMDENNKKSYKKIEQNTNNNHENNNINSEKLLFSINTNNNITTNPINDIEISNKKEDKQKIEEDIIITKREGSKKNINIINENNKEETINNNYEDIISDINTNNNKEITYSKTIKNKKSQSFMKDNNKNEEKLGNNSQNIQLNYLTEFYQTLPQENKSILMKDIKKGNNIGNEAEKRTKNKSHKEEKEKEEEDNEKDELEDEVGSIDEFHDVNDNRSILSSYIFNSVHISENKSIAQSINTLSEYQDSNSNFNDIVSNRGGGFIPSRINSKEFEFRFDKGMNYVPLMRENSNSKNMKVNPNINSFLNSQINYSIKKVKNKINDKDTLIKKNNDNINNIKNKIKIIEDTNKQYEKWIEKVEEENKRLCLFLNYLMTNN